MINDIKEVNLLKDIEEEIENLENSFSSSKRHLKEAIDSLYTWQMGEHGRMLISYTELFRDILIPKLQEQIKENEKQGSCPYVLEEEIDDLQTKIGNDILQTLENLEKMYFSLDKQERIMKNKKDELKQTIKIRLSEMNAISEYRVRNQILEMPALEILRLLQGCPLTMISSREIDNSEIAIADLLVLTGISLSKSEAKQLISNGGYSSKYCKS